MRTWLALSALIATVLGAPGPQGRADSPSSKVEETPEVEFHEMLLAILLGNRIGPDGGWFHPSQLRHTWEWLAARHAVSVKDAISRERFRGPANLFDRLDRNHDGVLRADDFDWSPAPRPKGPPPAMPDRSVLLRGLFVGELGSWREGPKIDDPAPDFTLGTADGKRRVSLSSFKGKKPVVLVFGSFT